MDEDRRAGAYEYIRGRLHEGRQAYIICPLISDSEGPARAAEVEAERLASGGSVTTGSTCCTAA